MRHLVRQFFADRSRFFLAITRNYGEFDHPVADEYMYFYVRLGLWMALPTELFIAYLDGFLPSGLAEECRAYIFFIFIPMTMLGVWVAHRGRRIDLLYGMYLFKAGAAIIWALSVLASLDYHEKGGMNYYLYLPMFLPVVVGTIIIFCYYPIQILVSNTLFFTFVAGFPFVVDTVAFEQYPAFLAFVSVVMFIGIFVFAVINITAVLYRSLAENEEKQAALEQAEAILSEGLDAAPFGLLVYDQAGALLLERSVGVYFADTADYQTQEAMERYASRQGTIDWQGEPLNVVQLEFAGIPVMLSRKQTGMITVYSFVDMRERKIWEERALTAEKLSLVGQITSGVTHDYNNCLAVAIGSLERFPKEDYAELWQEYLELVFSSLDQARRISLKLLALSGSRNLRFQRVEMRASIEAMRPILKSVVPDHIQFALHNNTDFAVITDRAELEAALLNLVINAKNALGKTSGEIIVETAINDEWATIRVRDNGPGIPDDIRHLVFDPFFSTRKGRHSSGLGLTTVKSFIEESKGQLSLNSVPGNTCFELKFPLDLSLAPEVSRPPMTTDGQGEPPRLEEILLIDDNLPLLQVTSDLLEKNGLRCHIANNATRARQIVQGHETIDAVFIDLSMPDISGIELGAELMLLRPGSRYYLLTGEGLTDRVESAQDSGFRGVFFKPLRVGELLEAAIS